MKKELLLCTIISMMSSPSIVIGSDTISSTEYVPKLGTVKYIKQFNPVVYNRTLFEISMKLNAQSGDSIYSDDDVRQIYNQIQKLKQELENIEDKNFKEFNRQQAIQVLINGKAIDPNFEAGVKMTNDFADRLESLGLIDENTITKDTTFCFK